MFVLYQHAGVVLDREADQERVLGEALGEIFLRPLKTALERDSEFSSTVINICNS